MPTTNWREPLRLARHGVEPRPPATPYSRRAIVALAAFAAVMTATTAHSLTLLPSDFNEMVAGSQTIVHGRVVDVRAQATTGAARTIESVVTVAVIDAIKGTSTREVTFRVPGGRLGRYRRVVVGAPEFATGQEVVVFLSGTPPVLPIPFGISQGVYRVADGVVRADVSRHPLAIGDFVSQVRSVAGAAR